MMQHEYSGRDFPLLCLQVALVRRKNCRFVSSCRSPRLLLWTSLEMSLEMILGLMSCVSVLVFFYGIVLFILRHLRSRSAFRLNDTILGFIVGVARVCFFVKYGVNNGESGRSSQ
jgi:hypothetical protein